jgi:hypothetical protein
MNWGVLLSCGQPQRLQRAICAALALAGTALSATSAQAQVANGTAQAVIVEPLGLVKIADLRFGRMAVSSTAGTVTVDPNTGACAVTGGVVSAGGCGFAQFGGQGVRRMRLRIQVPTTITLTGPGGATMVANTITLGTAPELQYIGGNGNGLGNGNRRYEITSNTGIFTFRIGGRLNVGANQAPGVYTGTFNVTVQYQ